MDPATPCHSLFKYFIRFLGFTVFYTEMSMHSVVSIQFALSSTIHFVPALCVLGWRYKKPCLINIELGAAIQSKKSWSHNSILSHLLTVHIIMLHVHTVA